MLRFCEYVHRRVIKKTLLDRYGKYSVYLVDGEQVRDSSSAGEEFGLSADYFQCPKVVPKDEIWIEDSVSKKERPVLISAELYFLRLIERGKSKDSAYDAMLTKEKDHRDSVRLSCKNLSKINKKVPPKVYAKRYGHIQDENIAVWLVNGNEVRDDFKVDWLEGGNPAVYPFCPTREIWLEMGEHRDEQPFILLHEYTEMTVMHELHLDYDHAHTIASKVEFAERKKGNFTKQEALSLTKEKAMQMAREYVVTQNGKK